MIKDKVMIQKSNTSNLEKQIDMMVYELYGLSEDEMSIVEGDQC